MSNSTSAALEALIGHLEAERDFNEKWTKIHELEGHPNAAAVRREVVAERQRWIDAVREVLVCSC
jgi:hypothetical protein